MKNSILAIMLATSLVIATCACGANKDQSSATVPTAEAIANVVQEENVQTASDESAEANGSATADSNDSTDTSEETAAEDIELPAYEYPGPELFYSVLYKYITDEFGPHYEDADVGIPCPIIIAEDETDKNDIKVWGNFWYYTYELKGDTLECKAGGAYPGLIHIKSTDEGYEVTGMEVVGDGSDFDPTSRQIFGDHYTEFIMSNANSEGNEQIRAQIIANYVAANNLPITQYQDFGWDPVKLPEENIDSFYSILD